MTPEPKELGAPWRALRAERMHALEIAQRLGVTEVELLASACGGAGEVEAVRLHADWAAFLMRMPELGEVKAITRNPSAVIEVEGAYGHVEFFEHAGQSVGAIDLRLFVRRWKHGFAVREENQRGVSRSLQFFDDGGRAVHKVYLRPQSRGAVYDELVRAHRARDQNPSQAVGLPDGPALERPDGTVDVPALRTAWRAMTDTHQFFGLLRKLGLTRTQALRLAGDDLATPLATPSLPLALEAARDAALDIMVFVGNPGVIQIYSGRVAKVVPLGPWINVLDSTFNLHVRGDHIQQAWRVTKPTSDGPVTSLELYDQAGTQIALLVGKRKPGQAENPDWTALMQALPRLGRDRATAPRGCGGAR